MSENQRTTFLVVYFAKNSIEDLPKVSEKSFLYSGKIRSSRAIILRLRSPAISTTKNLCRHNSRSSFDDNFAHSVDDGSFVKTFGNVNSDYVHLKHPFGQFSDFCGSKSGSLLKIRRPESSFSAKWTAPHGG